MKNYYHLTKKELSYLSSIEEPLTSMLTNQRLSSPVVLVFHKDGTVLHVWTLKWFRYQVKNNYICPDNLYIIRSMY